MAPTSLENIIKRILAKGKYKKLGKKQIDGIDCEGFEFDDKRAMLSVDKQQIENILSIVRDFGLDFYTEEIEPDYKKIQKFF